MLLKQQPEEFKQGKVERANLEMKLEWWKDQIQ